MNGDARKQNRPTPARDAAGEPRRRPGGEDRPAALYIHVPFCVRKCRYCDFYSVPLSASPADAYVEAAAAEIDARAGELATPLESVFVGGGTPTALGGERLAALLAALAGLIDGSTEVTVEANPGTIEAGLARRLADLGVNRVTLGAQSFEAGELATLGRIHSAGQTGEAVAAIRRAGITNVGLDLIYGIPAQTLATWRRTLREALALSPEHLSCYALSFEAGTPFARDLAAGRLAEMPDDDQADCHAAAVETLTAAGFGHYEISNFALPGRACRHNLTYWHNRPYLGIGPAAASYVGGVRWTNRPDLDGYVASVRAGERPAADAERLTGRAALAEALMLGLRLTQGISREELARRFGADPIAAFPGSIARHQRTGALVVTPSRLRLAPGALFVADTVLADILAEA